ncbi:MAG TPA: hypothetical protein VIR81_10480 [Myxococcales bacterium]
MIAVLLALTLSLQGSPPPGQPSSPASPAQPGDIDLLPPQAAPDAATAARQRELESQLHRRRQMLQLHQLGGMLTLASLGATVVFGELNYIDKYGGGGDTGRWSTWHKGSAFTASAIFAATGALAILAPSPLEKRTRLDTAMLHKIAMGVATAGMVAQIVLGVATAGKEGSVSQRDFALAHQIVGFTTFGATAVGFGVLTF